MELISLTETNYKDYLNQDVIAFSFSGAGSMGEKCTVYIINRLGEIFRAHFNEEILHEHIEEVCQPLKTVEYGIFGSDNKDKEWSPFYLGGGNFLQIHNSILDIFKSEVEKKMNEKENFFLYSEWIDIVLSIAKPK